MSKQRQDKFTAPVTSEKPAQDKFFVQAEGEYIATQLEAIADAMMKLTALYTGFKQELMSKHRPNKFTSAGLKPRRYC